MWGSTDINPQGERLMEYLVSTKLSILNKGNEPTFLIRIMKKVIDLTLGTDKIGDLVTNWHVSDDISLSDHRYIVLQVGDLEVTTEEVVISVLSIILFVLCNGSTMLCCIQDRILIYTSFHTP
jgi:hypothetical protein